MEILILFRDQLLIFKAGKVRFLEVLKNPEYVSTELNPYHELLRDSTQYFFSKKSL